MILEEETFSEFGYYPGNLTNGSHKAILAKCDECGKIRKTSKNAYRELCRSCGHLGFMHSEESKLKMRRNHFDNRGKNHPLYGKRGEDSIWYGRHHTKKTKERMSEAKRGEKCVNWQGGISFEPYCVLFNDEFRERVREYWSRKCALCDKNEEENERKMNVHHVTYNKDTCCDDSIPLFVTLCNSCHSKTHSNREYWKNKIIKIIYSKNKEGKCFYTKEEMSILSNEMKSDLL